MRDHRLNISTIGMLVVQSN